MYCTCFVTHNSVVEEVETNLQQRDCHCGDTDCCGQLVDCRHRSLLLWLGPDQLCQELVSRVDIVN